MTEPTESGTRAPAGVRQWLLLVAPVIGAVGGAILPWSGGTVIQQAAVKDYGQAFAAYWEGAVTVALCGAGVVTGILVLLGSSLRLREILTRLSMAMAVGAFALSLAFAMSLQSRDPQFQSEFAGVVVYPGVGLGLLLAASGSLAWVFAGAATWTWGKAPRNPGAPPPA